MNMFSGSMNPRIIMYIVWRRGFEEIKLPESNIDMKTDLNMIGSINIENFDE